MIRGLRQSVKRLAGAHYASRSLVMSLFLGQGPRGWRFLLTSCTCLEALRSTWLLAAPLEISEVSWSIEINGFQPCRAPSVV